MAPACGLDGGALLGGRVSGQAFRHGKLQSRSLHINNSISSSPSWVCRAFFFRCTWRLGFSVSWSTVRYEWILTYIWSYFSIQMKQNYDVVL